MPQRDSGRVAAGSQEPDNRKVAPISGPSLRSGDPAVEKQLAAFNVVYMGYDSGVRLPDAELFYDP